jgi:uncharacterized protein with NRDE domain
VCTVTILPESLLSAADVRTADPIRWRVACNRDELHTRPPAWPPTIWRIGVRRAIMPTDPDSGGTWIGVNDAGLVCSLLNVSSGATSASGALSRGTIIPPLLGCADVESAFAFARHLRPDLYQPFRLLIVDGRQLAECWSDRTVLRHRRQAVHAALMRTSSGLGDRVVRGPRAALFQRLFAQARDAVAVEDLFHLHQWHGREAVSVRMRRVDACTVSHTTIEIRDRTITFAYRPAEAPEGVSITMAA